MATLIQSKQIQGVVTASVIDGEFVVSGSSLISGSQYILGDITASGIVSASQFVGDGSQLTFGGTGLVSGSSQVTLSQVSGYNVFSASVAASISGSSTTLPNGVISSSAQLTSLGFISESTDSQTLTYNQVSKQLTISNGNTIDLSSLGGGGGVGGSSIWSTGSNYYYVNSDLQVTGSFGATSLTGSLDYSNLTNVPSGIVSSSEQVLGGTGILSGSHTQIPQGTISSSQQITDLGFISSSTSVPEGTISSSAQITALGFTSGSHTQLPSGIISGSEQLTSSFDSRYALSGSSGTSDFTQLTNVPSGLISSSEQVLGGTDILSGSHTDITSLNTFTSSIQTEVDGLSSATSSYLTSIDSGIVSSSAQVTELLPSGIISGSTFDNFSSSVDSRIDTEKARIDAILTASDADKDSFAEIVDLINSVDTQNDQAFAAHYTSSRQRLTSLESFTSSIQTEVDALSSATSSYLTSSGSVDFSDITSVPANIISGSEQISLLGFISESFSTGGTGIFSGSLVAGTNITINQVGNNFEISSSASGGGSTSVTVSDSAPGSPSQGDLWWKSDEGNLYVYYDGYWIISVDTTTALPTGVISGSSQLTSSLDSRYSLSGSSGVSDYGDLTNVPANIISSSQQITDLGFISSSHTDITSLNTFTSSIQTEVDGLSAQTSSYLTELPSGTISGSSQLTSSFDTRYALSGSGGSADTTYDGNRVISNEDLGDLFTNSVNPGTSGSIQDFLNAVFYPNTGPSISTGNQTISEYVASGSSIVTLSGTDPEGQAITFGTASAYTDDLVRVESGVLKLNALAESSSFNTDSVGGGHGHLVTVTATDTFGTTTEKDIYVIVTPNEAPKFRQTSVGGSVITSFTANLNESSPNSTVVGTIYFTDAESDTITIYSSSIDNNHFVINKYPTYVQIVQNTGSLDYEQQTSYSFSISASDEHYEAGQDSDSITTLPITINVTDNVVPVVNNQTLSSISENSSNGATVDTIAASDSEGDTITFVDFTLYKLELDNVDVPSGSYGGTSQLTDPHENPFQMSTSGVVTRKTGVYLNSDLINEYQYTVAVKDSYNEKSSPAIVTIPITDDTAATLSDNWSTGPFIKESEVSGTTIKTTNYGSTTADYNSNQSGTWSSSNPAISINSNGNLSLGVDLSGSVTQSGDTLDSTITFTNTFGTTTTDNLSVTIVENSAPFATFVQQSSNFNTNLATNGTNLETVSISDDESDTPYSLSIGGTDASSLNAVPQNAASSSWQLQANGNLSAGTYNYTVTVRDSYSKQTTYTGRSITIAEATTGSLSTNGTFYVIESATNGDNIVTSTNGRTGTQGSVSVSYSPNYGTQSAGSFTSSNGLISINSSTGVLSVGTDISGSGNTNGSTITSTIGWTDQYGNNGSDTITVNVAKNNAPTLLSTQVSNNNTNRARNTNQILQLRATDTEGDTIPNSGLSLSGYNTTYFTPNISTPYLQLLVNSTNVPAGTYPYTASFQDEHGFDTTTVSGSFTITQSDTGSLGGDTSIYIIESATSGDVFRDATGYNQGNAAQLSVSYSPNDGSAAVQSYTSSNAAITVDNSGNLTLGVDISGSVTQSGDTFTSTITFSDQYGNTGNGVVTATVFGNTSPAASFTATSDYNTDGATSGSTAGTLTVSDTESNSPFSVTLAGTDGGKFDVSGSSSPFEIQPTGSLSAGTYTINITVTDSYSESVTLTGETITVSSANDYGKVYIYTSTRTGGGALNDGIYDGILGITSENTSFEPDLITGYQSTGPSPIYALKTGDLGSSSITVGGGTMTLRNTVSGSNLDTIISSSFNGNGSTAEQIMIIFPSGSDMDGIPTSMTDSLGGSTNGEYVLYLKAAGESSYTVGGTQIHMFDVDSAVEGYTRWNIIGRNSVNTAASYEVRLIPSSGSAP